MEEIKDLIQKIQEEGIQAAEEKARKIEEEASRVALDIIHKAKFQADKILNEAKETCAQMRKATQESLRQAGRDLLLDLKKEINLILEKIMLKEIRHALSSQELDKIILNLIKDHPLEESGHIQVMLAKDDLDKIEGSILEKIKGELKKGIVLKPSEDILFGFAISYDSGKSYFDFTDKALAEYISTYLKPQLEELLK